MKQLFKRKKRSQLPVFIIVQCMSIECIPFIDNFTGERMFPEHLPVIEHLFAKTYVCVILRLRCNKGFRSAITKVHFSFF